MTTGGAVILRYAAMGIKAIESVAPVVRTAPTVPLSSGTVLHHPPPGQKFAAIDH